jgi:RNA polymerase sigma-70 factor (ECF subfamily)
MDLSQPADHTSLTLLDRARAHDGDAWRQLVIVFSPLIFHWAQRNGCSPDDAADVVQDVWTSVSTGLGRFHRDANTGSFRGWLWTITRNRLVDRARKASVASAVGGTDAQIAIQQVSECEPSDDSGDEKRALVQRVLESIRPQFEPHVWHAFWELTTNNRTASEVGQELSMDANAVRQAKFRVLSRLRRELHELGEDAGTP